MIVRRDPPLHLTYCLNVHAGESWGEVWSAIRTHACAVRDRVRPGYPFGLGLRLGFEAAGELARAEVRDEFKAFLRSEDLYVFTLNGFPYGPFHGQPVKEQVYAPDWRTPERLSYTRTLVAILADLLPDGEAGSISTVPVSFRPWLTEAVHVGEVVHRLSELVAYLAQLEAVTGKEIHVGLEPEPGCVLETAEDTVTFFNEHLLRQGCSLLQQAMGVSGSRAEALVRRHLGVCLDTCHAAVAFEDPTETLQCFQAEGLRVSKVQLSAALNTTATPEAASALLLFDEPTYLHQVRLLAEDKVLAWNDLPACLTELAQQRTARPVRVHFHVPLFWAGDDTLGSTSHTLTPSFFRALTDSPCGHLEIETYTFDVLPEPLRCAEPADSIALEYDWVRTRLGHLDAGTAQDGVNRIQT